jgi:rare lipoprotein A (peptidoglycan hydrolase)
VTTSVGLRAAALAGVALLGIAIALAVSQGSGDKEQLPPPAGQWYSALAAPYTPKSNKSACGVRLGPKTAGVAHPVLPCGAKIYIEFQGREVLTQVIDRGHTAPGRVFDVTRTLAKMLRLQGTQTVRWRFAS